MEVTLHLNRTLAGGLERQQVGSFPILGGEKPYRIVNPITSPP